MVVAGALAMIATMPGRTHGLGMITERLLADPSQGVSRVQYGTINFWATILGATFCFAVGPLIDRFGSRIVLTLVTALLGATVLSMTATSGAVALAIAITFTRGFGQSALSVVSLTLVGKWFRRRLSLAMAGYSALVSIGFMAAFVAAGKFARQDWRVLWGGMGWILLGLSAIFLLWVRSRPAPSSNDRDMSSPAPDATGATLSAALRSPAFWLLALASSLYGLVSSGVSIFNESLLTGLGFTREDYYRINSWTPFVGLAANVATGALASRISLQRLTAVALFLLAGSLHALPWVRSYSAICGYAAVMAAAGGMVTVLFFTAWGKFYGQRNLGRIQGAAQMLTVLASGLGPALMAREHARSGSYLPILLVFGSISAAMALAALFVPTPRYTSAEAT